MTQAIRGGDVPALVIAFKRADALERCIQRLLESGVTKLYFAVDGPRTAEEKIKVDAVKRVIDAVPKEVFCQLRSSPRNKGCRAWVSSSISWFFDHEEFGMIVEEDILLDPRFPSWCAAQNSLLASNERIMHLNAFYPESPNLPARTPHLTRYATSWGWATWRRAWRRYDDSMHAFLARSLVKRFFFLKRRMGVGWLTTIHYFLALHMTAQGKLSSWAYRWNLSIWSVEGLAVSPGTNLSENIGVGGDASHTSHETHLLQYVPRTGSFDPQLAPEPVSAAVDNKVFAAVSRSGNLARTFRMLGSVLAPHWVFARVRRVFR